MSDDKSFPPGLDEQTRQLVEWGKWSCEKLPDGWVIRTEPYSWCCNQDGQSAYHFDKDGNMSRSEHGLGKP